MGSVSGILAEARKHLGYRESNLKSKFGIWYGDQVKSAAFDTAPWCDAFISYIATVTDNKAAVCPGGIRAYTVYHADDFRNRGRWHSDIAGIRAGDIVFYDWGYTNSIGAIDHVGIVEKVLSGGRVQTIEGNTDNACLRRIRTASTIAGYGRPAYTGTTAQEEDDMEPSTVVKIPAYYKESGRNQFSHPSYPASFLWAGAVSETRSYGKQMLAKQAAMQATIDKLVDLVASGGGLSQAAVDAFKAELRKEIDGIVVTLKTSEA